MRIIVARGEYWSNPEEFIHDHNLEGMLILEFIRLNGDTYQEFCQRNKTTHDDLAECFYNEVKSITLHDVNYYRNNYPDKTVVDFATNHMDFIHHVGSINSLMRTLYVMKYPQDTNYDVAFWYEDDGVHGLDLEIQYQDKDDVITHVVDLIKEYKITASDLAQRLL